MAYKYSKISMCGDRTGPTYINNQPEWPIKQVIHLNNQPEWPIKPSGTLSIQLKKESTAKKKLAKQFSNFNDLQQRILNILQTVYWRKWTCGILLLKLIFSLSAFGITEECHPKRGSCQTSLVQGRIDRDITRGGKREGSN